MIKNILFFFIMFSLLYISYVANVNENFNNIPNIEKKIVSRDKKEKLVENSLYVRGKLPKNDKNFITVLVSDHKFFIDNELKNIEKNTILNIIDHKRRATCDSVTNYKNFLNNSNVKKVYSENWFDKDHKKLKITPIGIAYTMFLNNNENNIEWFVEASNNGKKLNDKPLKILCNSHFLIHKKPKSGSYNQRQEMIDKLKDNNLVDFWKNKKTHKETWNLHDNYSFELCPEGNGLDTHRFYEALFLNTIPIVKKNNLESLYKQYPCVIVNDWNEITKENCIKWKKDLQDRVHNEKNKLTMEYWYNDI